MKIRKQRGLTLVGFGMVLVLVVFFAYTGMKLVPLYLEYHALTNAMDTLKNNPAAAKMSPPRIKESLINSLWVNYATDNIQRKHMRVTKSDGIKVRVTYEVRKEWVGNVDLIAKFDRTVQLK
jgi:hypothetical protein